MYFEYFSCMCTAGTWPVHCVCSSYLVGCVMCGGVARGSGNVDFFQDNHANPTTTLPAPSRACAVSPLPGAAGWEGHKGWCFVPTDQCPCADPWILKSSEVSRGAYPHPPGCILSVKQVPFPMLAEPGEVGWGLLWMPCLVVQGNP